jgi:hypothetical protein
LAGSGAGTTSPSDASLARYMANANSSGSSLAFLSTSLSALCAAPRPTPTPTPTPAQAINTYGAVAPGSGGRWARAPDLGEDGLVEARCRHGRLDLGAYGTGKPHPRVSASVRQSRRRWGQRVLTGEKARALRINREELDNVPRHQVGRDGPRGHGRRRPRAPHRERVIILLGVGDGANGGACQRPRLRRAVGPGQRACAGARAWRAWRCGSIPARWCGLGYGPRASVQHSRVGSVLLGRLVWLRRRGWHPPA